MIEKKDDIPASASKSPEAIREEKAAAFMLQAEGIAQNIRDGNLNDERIKALSEGIKKLVSRLIDTEKAEIDLHARRAAFRQTLETKGLESIAQEFFDSLPQDVQENILRLSGGKVVFVELMGSGDEWNVLRNSPAGPTALGLASLLAIGKKLGQWGLGFRMSPEELAECGLRENDNET